MANLEKIDEISEKVNDKKKEIENLKLKIRNLEIEVEGLYNGMRNVVYGKIDDSSEYYMADDYKPENLFEKVEVIFQNGTKSKGKALSFDFGSYEYSPIPYNDFKVKKWKYI